MSIWSRILCTGQHLVLQGKLWPSQYQATDVKTLQPNDVAIVKFSHQQKELCLRPWIFGTELMHLLQRRHFGLCACYFCWGTRSRKLRSTEDLEVAVLPWPFMKLKYQRAVGVCKIWRVEEIRSAKEKVVARTPSNRQRVNRLSSTALIVPRVPPNSHSKSLDLTISTPSR